MGSRVLSQLRRILDIRRSELPLALLMFSFFFLVISTFWILKPIKKAMFVAQYAHEPFRLLGWSLDAPQAEQIAKVGNMLVAIVAVYFFSSFSQSLRRERLCYVVLGFCLACNVALAVAVPHGGAAVAWLLYLYGDLFNTVMVATFFAFLADSFSPDSARRTFGFIVLGGVAGGAVGSTIVASSVDRLGAQGWLLVSAASAVVTILIAWAAGREVRRNAIDEPAERWRAAQARAAEPQPERPAAAGAGNPALVGARLISRSRYLAAIVIMAGAYELISAIIDFQFTSAVVNGVPEERVSSLFADVYMVTNLAALAIQVLLTSLIMTNLSVRTALLITPVAIMAVSTGFLVVPTVLLGCALSVFDHSLSYTIHQSAREALFTTTSREEKYSAKAFIDMFVQRFAKAAAILVNIAMTAMFSSFHGVRYLSLVVIGLTAMWLRAAAYAGARFAHVQQQERPATADGVLSGEVVRAGDAAIVRT